jgi:signal transduction histidine kinase
LVVAKARNIELTVAPVETGVAVSVDRKLLASAVSNLLENALKFTHASGHVSVRTRTKADRIVIEVEDQCGGMPPDKVEKLFRPFERRGTDKTALGRGPAIVRKSAGASGGEIQVENMPGKGCVFTIEVPIAA